MVKKRIALFLVFIYSVMIVSAYDAHEHGAAEMQILVEEKQLEIILHIPGADFIGFEHEPLNDEEENLIHEKIESLESSEEDILTFRTRRWMKVLLEELHIEESGHDDHEEESEHMEFEMHFTYSMENDENLKDMQLSGLFKTFPTLSEIHWIMINPSGQSAGEADSPNSRIEF